MMRKLVRVLLWLLKALPLLLPLLLIAVPLPLAGGRDSLTLRAVVLLGIYGCTGIFMLGLRRGRRLVPERCWSRRLYTFFPLVLAAYSAAALRGVAPYPSRIITAVVVLAALWFAGALLTAGTRIKASGLLSLAACAALLFTVEIALREIPDRFLKPEILETPPLAPGERGREWFRKNHFRGKMPCQDCGDEVRIFTMGGSSTYGIPMFFGGNTYTARLERILKQRRPQERYEVVNAGVAGFGIIQILDSLEHMVLRYKPKIVTVMAWFNDAAPAPGWYGVPGLSDRDVYARYVLLRKLEKLPVFKQLHRTRIFALFRYYLVNWRGLLPAKPAERDLKILRMNPNEFAWGLERVAALGRRHGFLPVFILEPLNRSMPLPDALRRNHYYNRVMEVAERNGIPLVNPLDSIAESPDSWLFYDFIHPNRSGHYLIAETLYRTLFFKDKLPPQAAAFLESIGVQLDRPPAEPEPLFQFERKAVAEAPLTAVVRAPYADALPVTLAASVDGAPFTKVGALSREFQTYTLPLPKAELLRPIVDVRLKGIVEPAEPLLVLGGRAYRLALSLKVVSGGRDYGQRAAIFVQGSRRDPDSRGYNVVVLGGRSGLVRASEGFDVLPSKSEAESLLNRLSALDRFTEDGVPPIVIMAVNTDGHHNLDIERLSQALVALGGDGAIPEPFESFVLIGSPGLPRGAGIQEQGLRPIQKEFGRPEYAEAGLLEVQQISAAAP